MYRVVNSEPGLWTVGFDRPDTGRFEPDSDHDSPREAKFRAAELNGVEGRFVYLRTEPGLWTVGEFVGGTFEPDSDHGSQGFARSWVIELNA